MAALFAGAPRLPAALLAFLSFVAPWVAVSADQHEAPPSSLAEAAWRAAAAALQPGPKTIVLGDQARLDLPDGYGFVPQQAAADLMEAWGNNADDRLLGVVLPLSDAGWFATVEFEPSGYIKDDDAKEWDADALLEDLKAGTEAANPRREQMGFPPIEVTGWAEVPAYEGDTHRLVWSAEARDLGESNHDSTINYNTYVLGREGFVSLNLVTSSSAIDVHKPAAKELLRAVSFNEGKRYEDFDSSTDKVAAYGLAALIGGVAAKKLGLIALAGAFFVKFAKVIILALAAVVGLLVKVLRRDRAPPSPDEVSK